MSSKNTRNRQDGKPVDTANIHVPHGAYTKTDIPQPELPEGARLASRKRMEITPAPARRQAPDEAPPEILEDQPEPEGFASTVMTPGPDHNKTQGGSSKKWKKVAPPSVLAKKGPPSVKDLDKLTRNDVELFFEASHAFRTRLATVLPDVADKIGRFILATPYTIIDASGHPIQMVPDVSAMTPAQAKLAGLVLNRLLPPLTDMDMEGKLGPGKGTHVDARQVRITVNTVGGPSGSGDSTDERLRNTGGQPFGHGSDGRYNHPNAARQVAPITMNLGEIVDRAKELMPSQEGEQIDPDSIESSDDEQSTNISVDRGVDDAPELPDT